MRLSIPFHSVVDLITNSSSVVYTWAAAGAEDAVRGIINEVLQKAGSNKTADDLYKVSVSVADSSFESFINQFLDEEENAVDPRYDELLSLDNGEGTYTEKGTRQRAYARKNFSTEEIEEELEDSWGEVVVETEIVVESLDGTDSKIDAILPKLFESEASYDG